MIDLLEMDTFDKDREIMKLPMSLPVLQSICPLNHINKNNLFRKKLLSLKDARKGKELLSEQIILFGFPDIVNQLPLHYIFNALISGLPSWEPSAKIV